MAVRTTCLLLCFLTVAGICLVGALPLEQARMEQGKPSSRERIDEEGTGYLQMDRQDASTWLQRSASRHQPERAVKRRVYGADDRDCTKKDSRSLPYSAIGYFEHAKCSGFMIAPNIIMTTASCLYDVARQTFHSSNYDFFRGGRHALSGDQEQPELMMWKSLLVPVTYLRAPWKENDYGFVVTSNSVNSSQHLVVAAANESTEFPLSMVSSSSVKDNNVCSVQCNATLYQHAWYARNEHNQRLFCYHCDTTSDSGGSPLLYNAGGAKEAGRTVVGVNVGYFASSFRGSCNVGARLTKERVESIRELISKEQG